jgi:NADP-dependent 3-hydroxy acid dehydrogenase YdfG
MTKEETSDAVSVISGGSDGMGLAAAIRLASEGGKIAILGRRQERLDRAVNEIMRPEQPMFWGWRRTPRATSR